MATSCAAAAGGALLEQPRLGLQALAAERAQRIEG
jgi:hypothetical protein